MSQQKWKKKTKQTGILTYNTHKKSFRGAGRCEKDNIVM